MPKSKVKTKDSEKKIPKKPPKPNIKDKNKDDKIWVVAYTRVSTKAEAQKTSIENQPKYFEKLFQRSDIKKKYKLVYFYTDWGISGTKISRLDFDDMLKDAGLRIDKMDYEDIRDPENPNFFRKQIKYIFSANSKSKPLFREIWVKSTSRFARNLKAVDIIDALRDNGVYVRFIDYDLSTENPSDYSKIVSLLNTDMDYSRALSKNMKAAKELVKEEGIVNSNGKLYGYDYHKRTKNKAPYFTINEEEANIVRKIFELYAYGDGETNIKYGVRRIGNYLANNGILNRDGKKFGPTTIRNMLSNEKYMGLHNPGKYTTGTVFNKYTTNYITQDYEKYLIETEDVPPIVDPKVWKACQKEREDRYKDNTNINTKGIKPKVGSNISQNKYAKFLKCRYCNGNFRYDNNRGTPFYTCSTKERDGVSACTVNNVFLTQLDELIERLKNGEYYELFRIDVETKLITLISVIEQLITSLEKPALIEDISRTQAIIDKQNKILNILIDSDEDDDDLIDKITRAKEKLKSAKTELKNLTATPDEIIPKINEIFDNCYNVINIYNNLKKTYTEEEILNKLDRLEVFGVRPESRKYPYKAGIMPIFKESATLSRLISFNMPQYIYRLKDGIGENDELLDAETINSNNIEYKTKSHWPKVTLDQNLFTNAYDLQTGYIKDFGIVDRPTVLEQIFSKLDLLKAQAEEIISKYSPVDTHD